MSLELVRVPAGRNEIALLAYAPRRPRGIGIVLGHGYSSSKQNLDGLAAFLSSHGFAIYSLDFPGHKLGASGGRLEGVEDLVDAMAGAVRYARAQGESVLYAAGHSMGASTALITAGRDKTIAGAISIATGVGRPSVLEAFSEKLVDLRSQYVDGLALPALSREVEPLVGEALRELAGRPQLFVAAERDMMVTMASARALFDSAFDPKSFATVASDHTYAGENARASVLAWLNELHPRAAQTVVA
jgi:alpha-beta hydrolase superfamily lysophospholipase